jgi:hypothetical protein
MGMHDQGYFVVQCVPKLHRPTIIGTILQLVIRSTNNNQTHVTTFLHWLDLFGAKGSAKVWPALGEA